jgi:hypothetical protein
MTTILKATTVAELENLSKAAYAGTADADGMHRGFHAAECETLAGKLECRATPCMSTRAVSDWFSFRYYLNGRAISKANLATNTDAQTATATVANSAAI